MSQLAPFLDPPPLDLLTRHVEFQRLTDGGQLTMMYSTHVPASPLDQVVAEMYHITGPVPAGELTLLLWPTVHLVANLGEEARIRRANGSGATLAGVGTGRGGLDES